MLAALLVGVIYGVVYLSVTPLCIVLVKQREAVQHVIFQFIVIPRRRRQQRFQVAGGLAAGRHKRLEGITRGHKTHGALQSR